MSKAYIWAAILLYIVLGFATVNLGAQPVPSAHFTDPQLLRSGKRDRSLIALAVRLTDATPRGEEISVCVFKMNDPDLVRALVRARDRGVHVRIILNDGDTSEEANEASNDALKDLFDHYYYIENDISGKAIIHNKFMLFSAVEQADEIRRHVVLQTSSNFDDRATHRLQDMVVLQDHSIYYAYRDYWYSMQVLGKADKLEHYDFFGMAADGGQLKAWFYPKRIDGEDHGKDDVLKALEAIEDPSGCSVFFAHGKWDEKRMEIIDALEKLASKGARIEIATGDDNDGDVLKAMQELDAKVHIIPEKIVRMHTKFFLLEYTEGGKKRQMVYTGSHNLTNRSLRKNFEVLLRLQHDEVYAAYLGYFKTLMSLN